VAGEPKPENESKPQPSGRVPEVRGSIFKRILRKEAPSSEEDIETTLTRRKWGGIGRGEDLSEGG